MNRHSTVLRTLSPLLFLLIPLLLPLTASAQRSLTLLAPNGGEIFTAGTSMEIRWTAAGFEGDEEVEIEFSVDGGGQWSGIDRIEASVGRLNWTIRNRPSETALVRVMSRDESVVDESDAYFTIEEDPLDMTILFSPNGGEEWHAGTTQTISWQAPVDAIDVLLEISLDFGFTWQEIGKYPAAQGSTTYVVPHLSAEVVTSAAVRVSVAEAPDHFDVSDAPFEIKPKEDNGGDGGDGGEAPTLSLLYPNGGEIFVEDSVVIIEWTSTNIPDRLEIEYSIDDGATWRRIDREEASVGSVDWRVPGEETSSGMIRVRREDGSIEDLSDAPFTIHAAPLVQTVLIAPQGGEQWRQGDTDEIIWSAPEDMTTALLEYSLDGGSDWTPIKIVPAIDSRHDWLVPVIADTAVPGVLIRIVDIEHAGRETTSGPITLLPKTGVAGIESDEHHGVAISPNPADGGTNIWLGAGKADVQIVGPDGRVVREFSAAGHHPIDLSSFATGLYFVRIRSGQDVREYRLVVIH